MVYAIILAAGIGKRFKYTPIKPLYLVKGKPLFLHSIDTFITNKKIDKVLLVINKNYLIHYQKYLQKTKYKNVLICFGDVSARWKSLIKGVQFANNHFKLQPQDILVTHDAARINVSRKIIDKNIEIARKYGFASTVLSLHDSIVEVKEQIKYLERSHKYIVQTPQTIQYRFWSILNPKNQKTITDLFTYLNIKLTSKNLVNGDLQNFKITTIEDLKLI